MPSYSEGGHGSVVKKYSSNHDERRNKRSLGSEKEQIAEKYLRERGYRILERNFRCRQGEIDLIGRDGKYLVFIEVKYRADGRAGAPEEAVNRAKQRTILQVARYYLYRNRFPEYTPCRFDVVGIIGDEIRLTKDAFGLNG